VQEIDWIKLAEEAAKLLIGRDVSLFVAVIACDGF
jgi:hypothetical protein